MPMVRALRPQWGAVAHLDRRHRPGDHPGGQRLCLTSGTRRFKDSSIGRTLGASPPALRQAHADAAGGDLAVGHSRAVAFMGWFGARGLASIVFAVIVEDAHLPYAGTIVAASYLTVGLSVLVHGALGGAAGRSLRHLVPSRRGQEPSRDGEPASARAPGAGIRVAGR